MKSQIYTYKQTINNSRKPTVIIIKNLKTKTMRITKKSCTLLLSFLLILMSMFCMAVSTEITGKVVEIQPVALDVIISIYDRAVILFTNGVDKDNVQLFENSIKNLVANSDGRTFNKTIFGVCDLDKDKSGKLKKYGDKPSVQIINSLTNYQLLFPQQKQKIQQFWVGKFPQFMVSHTSSQAKLVTTETLPTAPSFLILGSPTNNQSLSKFQKIYKELFDYLNFFNTTLVLNKYPSAHNKIEIYNGQQLYKEYAQSAVNALLNFTEFPVKEEINQLVDFINVETTDNVTQLCDENYYRIFGSSIEYQMLFIYRQGSQNEQVIKNALQQYQKASISNRYQSLSYQRVLFAKSTPNFLTSYFSDTLLQPQNSFQILLTKPDYNNFQLRKYPYEETTVSKQKILQFIENVRNKKINPKYKSQKIQDNTNKSIRKIVGDNFYQEIFGQGEKSVLVLFVDSKDGEHGGKIGEVLREFVDKYEGAYKEFMNVGVFDLAKNQHKALTISTAPQLILFERSNKKKPKFFKGVETKQNIKNWLNYEAKDFTIPENYGQPPIALGGGGAQNSQL